MNKRERIYQRRRRNRKKLLIKRVLVITFLAISILTVLINRCISDETEKKVVKNSKEVVIKDDKSSATIELEKSTVESLLLGETYIEPGFAAEDKDGTDLTDQVQVDMSELNRVGEQQIIYTVKDKKGREAKAVRKIEILPNTEYETSGLPICMYHYIYDKNNPPENLNTNFISTEILEEEISYLKDNNYYFPTWQEVRDYVDGKVLLPEKSIVLCFDDDPKMIELGVPIFEKHKVPVTCFVITGYWNSKDELQKYKSEYVHFETHSQYMHEAGGTIGHGGIYTALTHEEIISDLTQSINMCGNGNAFAYPFGDYTEDRISALQEVGLLCAVTTEPGKSYPGQNPYLLPRVRMSDGQTLEEFIAKIQG